MRIARQSYAAGAPETVHDPVVFLDEAKVDPLLAADDREQISKVIDLVE